MVRHWFSFLESVKERRLGSTWLLAILLGATVNQSALAEKSSLQKIAELPLWSWQNLKDAKDLKLKPGDSIELGLELLSKSGSGTEIDNINESKPPSEPGLKKNVTDFSRIKLEVPPGSSPLIDLGWTIRLRSKMVILTPLKSGVLRLPMLVIKDENDQMIGRTEAIELKIDSVTPKKQSTKILLDPLGTSFPWRVVLVWIAMAMIVIVFVILIVSRFNRPKRKILESKKAMPLLSPRQEALKSLRLLEEKKYWEEDLFKKHYFELSHILKRFVAREYQFDATEQTAREILRKLKSQLSISLLHSNEKIEWIDELGNLFKILDRVKFSDFEPNRFEAKELIERSRRWIEKSKSQNQKSNETMSRIASEEGVSRS